MKKLILCFLTTISLNASLEQKTTCSSILKEINTLEEERDIGFFEKVGSFFVSGNYSLESSSKEIENKIRILKLKLSNCKD